MTDLKRETERLLALADAATKDWKLRKHPRIEHQCFVESPPANGMAYGLEVFGDDYTGYGDEEQRAKDLEFAASAHDMAAHIRVLQAEVDRLTERDQRLMTKLGTFKPCGDPEIDAVLGQDDPEWREWVDSMPDNHWSRYDLSALRLGWHFGRKALQTKIDAAMPRERK